MLGFTLRNPLLLVVWSIGFSVPRLMAEEPADFFENKVRPLLVEHCYSCHSAEAEAKGKLKAGLHMDSLEGLKKGGDSGPALTPEQVTAFLADESSAAFAKVVDSLLSSTHYRERWTRHWLDVARYSGGHAALANACDQGIAALLTDLKGRGLLDETLVVWGCEFGRAPTSEGEKGRDHDHYGYTVWMAGCGVKKGFSHGATDEFGCSAVEDRVHVHDMNATILHLMGLNHEKLTYRYSSRYSSRDYRLTDVHGHVVHDIIA